MPRRLLEKQAHEQALCFRHLVLDHDLGVNRISDAPGRYPQPPGDRRETRLKALADLPEVSDDGAPAILLEGGSARGERQRIASEGAGDEDLFELAHEVSAPDDRGERKPVGYALAENGQFWSHAEVLLGAPDRPAKTADDLVEDQQRPVPVRRVPHLGQKARGGRVEKHWLHDHGGDTSSVLFKRRLQRGQVVVGERDDELGEVLWDSLRSGRRERVPIVPARIATIDD